MKLTLTLCAVLLLAAVSFAQDPQVRAEAVRLMEHAHAVSTAATWPNLERSEQFRAFGLSSGPQDGTFHRIAIQGTGRRDETSFGSYHAIEVWQRNRVAVVHSQEVAPAEVALMMRLTPLNMVHFDDTDVIRAIVDTQRDGRSLRCIEFETIAGEKRDSNQLCVDATSGTLTVEKIGNELIENGDFFVFAGALIPGKITYSLSGVPKLEITQTMTPLTTVKADALADPPNAESRYICKMFRRPFGVSMPQPRPGNGSGEADVLIRALVGTDGRVHQPVVQASDRPDLNAEALSLVSQWLFTPGLCDGVPNDNEITMTVRFQGR